MAGKMSPLLAAILMPLSSIVSILIVATHFPHEITEQRLNLSAEAP